MLLVASLAPFVVLTTGVVASPSVARDSSVSLPFVKHINSVTAGPFDFIQRELARLKKYGIQQFGSGANAIVGLPLEDLGYGYVGSIGFGDPPTYYNLIIDTGSSNTWVGANKAYVPTSTSEKTCNSMHVKYGTGFFDGTEYKDSVTISPGVSISRQSIGVASNTSGIYPQDGILGIGPKVLTYGSLYPHNDSIIPTVTDNLFSQGQIEHNLVSVSFEPSDSEGSVNGELSFGGTDSTKYTGDITYFPITETFPSNLYWGVNASFLYGNTTILDNAAGIIDTGTTLIYIARGAYKRYVKATGAVFDKDTGFLLISPEKYRNLQSIFFAISGSTYELTRNAQTWPRGLNGLIGGREDRIYLVIQSLGRAPPPGLHFIAGMAFLERFYSVYDTENRRLGLATTQFTNAETN